MKAILFSLTIAVILVLFIKTAYGQESGVATPAYPWEMCGDGYCDNISENCVWCSKDCGVCSTYEPCSEYKTLLSLQFWSGDTQLYRADEESVPAFMIHLNNLSKVENYIDIRNSGCGLSNVNFYFDCPLSYENHTSLFFKNLPPNMTAKAFLALSIPSDIRKYVCQYVISSDQFAVRKNITMWLNDMSCPPPMWNGWTLYYNTTEGVIGKRTSMDVKGLPNEAIVKLNEIIMQNVSKEYFDEHIKLIDGRSISTVTCADCPIKGEIDANYKLTIEGYELQFGIREGVTWNDYLERWFDNGTLKCASHEFPVEYDSWSIPYLIKEYKNLLTKENAVELVKSCTGDVLTYDVSLSKEGMIFIAAGENKTAYMNLENGEIINCRDNVIPSASGGKDFNKEILSSRIIRDNWQIFVFIISIIVIVVVVTLKKRKVLYKK